VRRGIRASMQGCDDKSWGGKRGESTREIQREMQMDEADGRQGREKIKGKKKTHLRPDFPTHARHFRRKVAQVIHHRVDNLRLEVEVSIDCRRKINKRRKERVSWRRCHEACSDDDGVLHQCKCKRKKPSSAPSPISPPSTPTESQNARRTMTHGLQLHH
jgi:Holliday junction resolvase RusA-like endonuclease